MIKYMKRILISISMSIGAFSFLALLFIIYIFIYDSPGVFVEDADQAAAVLVCEYLGIEKGDVYISINGRDPENSIISNNGNNIISIHNLSELPECNVPDERDQDSSCEDKNILRARFEHMPAKYLAFVSFTTRGCGGRGMAAKIAGKWYLLKSHINCCTLGVVVSDQQP
ncbi:hypothetical protein [Nitrospirillum iridis]|uniref:Uncharacterized protein n=1 Tax=Nitrospirillum iridis TaxID=765888 RepID=A0A7X0EEY5_9PROT|nr:hypothetical protein [Nitrospirillum iridis]MBB6251939.1 hypothetical protein [Nitrospirillum iridis]